MSRGWFSKFSATREALKIVRGISETVGVCWILQRLDTTIPSTSQNESKKIIA